MLPDLPPLPIEDRFLPYVEQLDTRSRDRIEGVVIHCTETPDLATAREFGERVIYAGSGTGNSGHYYIDLDGQVSRWVPAERIAHHVRGANATTIGIELVNRGRWPRWYDADHQGMESPYPEAQLAALIALLQVLRSELPGLRWIAGHEDLDVARMPAADDAAQEIARKRDPGPLFPWARVLDAVPLERRTTPVL